MSECIEQYAILPRSKGGLWQSNRAERDPPVVERRQRKKAPALTGFSVCRQPTAEVPTRQNPVVKTLLNHRKPQFAASITSCRIYEASQTTPTVGFVEFATSRCLVQASHYALVKALLNMKKVYFGDLSATLAQLLKLHPCERQEFHPRRLVGAGASGCSAPRSRGGAAVSYCRGVGTIDSVRASVH